jgi:hypothetical protein
MVSLLFALQRAGNTMKNTIDDADYIINWIVLIIIFQCVTNSCHSGQTINKDFFKGLEFWQKLAGESAGKAWLVYGGDTRQIRSDVTVLPWHKINSERIVTNENTGHRSQ